MNNHLFIRVILSIISLSSFVLSWCVRSSFKQTPYHTGDEGEGMGRSR